MTASTQPSRAQTLLDEIERTANAVQGLAWSHLWKLDREMAIFIIRYAESMFWDGVLAENNADTRLLESIVEDCAVLLDEVRRRSKAALGGGSVADAPGSPEIAPSF